MSVIFEGEYSSDSVLCQMAKHETILIAQMEMGIIYLNEFYLVIVNI